MPTDTATLCACGCNRVVARGEFLRGHAVRHVMALRTLMSQGSQVAARELTWRGWSGWNPRGSTTEVRSTAFGVEMEFFGMERDSAVAALRGKRLRADDDGYHHRTVDFWRITHDGSVSGEGCECVSPLLTINREAHHEQLKRATAALRDNGGKVDRSCGLHVHHSATGMNPTQIAEVSTMYAAFQPAMDSIMPKSRHTATPSDYARQIRGVDNLNGTLRDPNFTRENAIQWLASRDRYEMVNLQSLAVHGSIEFRQHSGTLNAEKILNWVKLTRLFMDIGKRKTIMPLLKAHDFSLAAIQQDYSDIVKVLEYLEAGDDLAEYYLQRRDKFTAGTEDEEDKAVLLRQDGDNDDEPYEPDYDEEEHEEGEGTWCDSCQTTHYES